MNHSATTISEPAPQTESHHPEGQLQTIDVLLVDEDRAASYGLWALLSSQREMRIRATAESGAEAIRLVRALSPDICLVSAALEVDQGVRTAYALKLRALRARVLIYDEQRPSAELGAMAMIAGADGVLWRFDDPLELMRLISRTAAGKTCLPTVAGETVRELAGRVGERDRPIASMLMMGIPPDEIAWTLGVSAAHLRVRRDEIIKRLVAKS